VTVDAANTFLRITNKRTVSVIYAAVPDIIPIKESCKLLRMLMKYFRNANQEKMKVVGKANIFL